MTPRGRRILIILSLLLFALSVALCARSFFAADGISLAQARTGAGGLTYHGTSLVSDCGGVLFRHTTVTTNDPDLISRAISRVPFGRNWRLTSTQLGEARGRRATVSGALSCYLYARRHPSPGGTFRTHDVRISYWVPAVVGLLAPGLTLVRSRLRHHRAAKGLCPGCGYDLRVTPAACPECGERPESGDGH